MEIGIFSGVASSGGFDSILADAKASAEAGFASYWLPQIVQQAEAMNLIGAVAQHDAHGLALGGRVVGATRHRNLNAESCVGPSAVRVEGLFLNFSCWCFRSRLQVCACQPVPTSLVLVQRNFSAQAFLLVAADRRDRSYSITRCIADHT